MNVRNWSEDGGRPKSKKKNLYVWMFALPRVDPAQQAYERVPKKKLQKKGYEIKHMARGCDSLRVFCVDVISMQRKRRPPPCVSGCSCIIHNDPHYNRWSSVTTRLRGCEDTIPLGNVCVTYSCSHARFTDVPTARVDTNAATSSAWSALMNWNSVC